MEVLVRNAYDCRGHMSTDRPFVWNMWSRETVVFTCVLRAVLCICERADRCDHTWGSSEDKDQTDKFSHTSETRERVVGWLSEEHFFNKLPQCNAMKQEAWFCAGGKAHRSSLLSKLLRPRWEPRITSLALNAQSFLAISLTRSYLVETDLQHGDCLNRHLGCLFIKSLYNTSFCQCKNVLSSQPNTFNCQWCDLWDFTCELWAEKCWTLISWRFFFFPPSQPPFSYSSSAHRECLLAPWRTF